MGCSSSKYSVDPTVQYKLMRMAQSEGLHMDADLAMQTILQNPGVALEVLIEMLRDSLRPINLVRPRVDPRSMSSQDLLAAAASISNSMAKGHTPPVPLSHIDATTPSLLPADIPTGLLREQPGDEECVICACALLGEDGGDPVLSIRQLPCSHAFHSICIDVWLTEQAGNCPLCMAAYPRPAYESVKTDAYERFHARMANGGREEIEENQRAERERIDLLEREEELQRAKLERERFVGLPL